MNKLDVTHWREYQLEDLFQFVNSKAYHKKDIVQTDGSGLNYITRSKFNNGLNCKVIDNQNYEKNPAGTISFGAENANFFYQEEEYITGNKMYYIASQSLSKNTNLFLKTILESKFTNNFSFSDGMIPVRIKKEKILLPSKKNEDSSYSPDWEYMDNYIEKLQSDIQCKINNLKEINKNRIQINTSHWKFFHLYDLFDINMGTKLDKVKMKMDVPTIDFVGRANSNQGVSAQVNRLKDIEPYQSGNLTLALGGEYLGSCFIQKNNFYTSQNVIVLIPKTDMSFRVKQFISTVIFVESQLHYKAFIDELNPHIKTDFKFKLPVDDEGNPDWKYMEKYIEKVEFKVKTLLDNIRHLTNCN